MLVGERFTLANSGSDQTKRMTFLRLWKMLEVAKVVSDLFLISSEAATQKFPSRQLGKLGSQKLPNSTGSVMLLNCPKTVQYIINMLQISTEKSD